eukprot:jgi/Mesvir1/14585/Mv05260-RA.2
MSLSCVSRGLPMTRPPLSASLHPLGRRAAGRKCGSQLHVLQANPSYLRHNELRRGAPSGRMPAMAISEIGNESHSMHDFSMVMRVAMSTFLNRLPGTTCSSRRGKNSFFSSLPQSINKRYVTANNENIPRAAGREGEFISVNDDVVLTNLRPAASREAESSINSEVQLSVGAFPSASAASPATPAPSAAPATPPEAQGKPLVLVGASSMLLAVTEPASSAAEQLLSGTPVTPAVAEAVPAAATGAAAAAGAVEAPREKKPLLTLDVRASAAMIPHPEKAHRGGEDAFFITPDNDAFGVADGVGGWAEVGINPGLYARELMAHVQFALMGETRDPKMAIRLAHRRTRKIGSTTACVLVVGAQPNGTQVVRAANLGDSGFLLLRGGSVVFSCPAQTHSFNFPYQIGSHEGDDPVAAQVSPPRVFARGPR